MTQIKLISNTPERCYLIIDDSNNKFRSTYARAIAVRFLEKDNISQISKTIPDTFQQELNNEAIQYNTGIGLGIEQFVNTGYALPHGLVVPLRV